MSLPAPGAVEVEVDLPIGREAAWEAITEPELVEQWWGVLDGELRAGAQVRLDFEDGDFFDLGIEHVERPRQLAFRWRFMGTGPVNAIVLTVDGRAGCSTVRVRDDDPERDHDEAVGLGEGWRDFLSRLGRWASTGDRARYPLRSELDVTIELTCEAGEAWAHLLGRGGEAPWLPLEEGRLVDGAVLQAGQMPRATIDGVERDDSGTCGFDLRVPGIEPPMQCEIAVSARSAMSELAIRHAGWAELQAPERDRLAWRRECARLWIGAARGAAERVRHAVDATAPL